MAKSGASSLRRAATWSVLLVPAVFILGFALGHWQKSAEPARTAPASSANVVVPQRVVYYEESTGNPQGNKYSGFVLWRTETLMSGPGSPPATTIRADIHVPERGLALMLSIRPNADGSLRASHAVEIRFKLPDNGREEVAKVPGLLMKEAEAIRGLPLSGSAFRLAEGLFRIGLSPAQAEQECNRELLLARDWLDIPIFYESKRRALLAVEKGNQGERAFQEAFAAWEREATPAKRGRSLRRGGRKTQSESGAQERRRPEQTGGCASAPRA